MTQEFLPLCDVLFNIISLASYFCDVVFDVIVVYTLYVSGQTAWFLVASACVAASLLASQVLSIKWYLRHFAKHRRKECDVGAVFLVHFLQSGVLWRYFRLFVPVDLRYVKQAVRDLCLLRMLHAFCEAAPMLLMQLYLVWRSRSAAEITRLTVVSSSLSLFSVCWALASFNKHIRQRNLHKLVLTWLGVIYQFLWRLGTVSSRVGALTLYATLYHFWVFLVIALHWVSMFLWLISPRNAFHGEKLSRAKKCVFSALIAYVYVFCHINLQEVKAPQKMTAFYITMFLENTLLMAVWLSQQSGALWYKYSGVALVWGGFAFGIAFMLLYYRFFHVKRLKHGRMGVGGGAVLPYSSSSFPSCARCQLSSCSAHGAGRMSAALTYLHGEAAVGEALSAAAARPLSLHLHGDGTQFHAHSHQHSHHHHHHHHHNGYLNGGVDCNGGGGMVGFMPGVFNCRLNPAFKRKKKKPTSFVPVPVQQLSLHPNGGDRADVPFWKKPLPKPMWSDAEAAAAANGTAGSKVNIQQKLQEKKRQQLQELRVIEEEIKQGKLQRPHPTDMSEQGTLRQPIPSSKKQPWMHADVRRPAAAVVGRPVERTAPKSRSKTPEILLAPHYLEQHPRVYYDYGEEKWRFAPSAAKQFGGGHHQVAAAVAHDRAADMYKSYHISSDLDSQISLPRSYTLPREFKYHRKPKARKKVRSEHFVTSTNSSDGDVDSGDENDQEVLHQRGYRNIPVAAPVSSICNRNGCVCGNVYHSGGGRNLHETQL